MPTLKKNSGLGVKSVRQGAQSCAPGRTLLANCTNLVPDLRHVAIMDMDTGEELGRYIWDMEVGDLAKDQWIRVYQDWLLRLAMRRVITSLNEYHLLLWIMAKADFRGPVKVQTTSIARAWGVDASAVRRALAGLVRKELVLPLKGSLVRLNGRFAAKGKLREASSA